ncbi:MAG TPA: AraC family transcriptional regulator [Planctomycetota bacterium]|nr:AraC family transcriptional regulator [Planctomycetota bacterium]
MQNRSSRRLVAPKAAPQRFNAEPWNLPDEFPLKVVDYRMTRTQLAEFHVHNVLEIGLCRAGRGLFMVEDAALPFSAGDVFVISSLEAHSAYSLPEAPSEWTFVFVDAARVMGPSFAPALFDFSRSFRNHFAATDAPAMNESVGHLIREAREQRPYYRDAIRSELGRIIIACQRSAPERRRAARRRSFEAMKSIAPALKQMTEHYANEVEIAAMARACHLSESHFRRVFVQQLGCGPKEYLSRYRIGVAACLLTATDKRISDIAYETGFVTLSSFNRQFAKKKGCPPREWRRKGGRAGAFND